MFGSKGGMGGGGGALRTVERAVTRAGVGGVAASGGGGGGSGGVFQESIGSSSSTSPRRSHLSVAASPVSSVSSYQKSATSGMPIWDSGSAECEEYEWVAFEEIEDEGFCGYGFHGHYILGYPPSEDEVEDAVFALQHAFGSASPFKHVRDKYKYELDNDGSDQLDWVEPSLTPSGPRTLQAQGSEGVSYAFRLLQNDPSVQRMVKSLSSDKAVWNAVLNNEAVRELRESIFEDEEHSSESQDGTSEVETGTTANIVMQIFHSAKSKFMEVIEKITGIMNGLFQPENQKTTAEEEVEAEPCGRFNETVRIGFMLSIAVMLVVVGGRRAKSKREGRTKSSKA
ncbi:hypothetical protein L6164_017564 [Bauhinia variegata]|uniref:Uncharacterized protein n=1 Tax=Bauhinia variegata TaxID=167791 RepID=A0ACB9NAD4_BAUVA|nr:hypothetical protein L6164_017564 [Bauhinia variegata]